ncbi:MAG: ABC transporter ATP-binding protein [Zoogloeaceae bacterium]|jgi:putative ABC transport system ATP-binding protein/lipoprotein-releasing system ATP-binding protein|nr:ABC transporter ATP-binding protein [Zoogloeaceae bacterium]
MAMKVELRELNRAYRIGDQVIEAVRDVSLSIDAGEFAAIIGHSGSGKSTLLSMIGGLARPTSGTVLIEDVDIWARDDAFRSDFRNARIGFVFQFASLIPTLNAVENVALPRNFGKGGNRAQDEEEAIMLLERVGLGERLFSYPSELSGGQQRRVAIARALINSPALLLADEPTGDLDEETEAEVMELLLSSCRKTHAAFLMVTHNRAIAEGADHVFRLKGGALQ